MRKPRFSLNVLSNDTLLVGLVPHQLVPQLLRTTRIDFANFLLNHLFDFQNVVSISFVRNCFVKCNYCVLHFHIVLTVPLQLLLALLNQRHNFAKCLCAQVYCRILFEPLRQSKKVCLQTVSLQFILVSLCLFKHRLSQSNGRLCSEQLLLLSFRFKSVIIIGYFLKFLFYSIQRSSLLFI
jgi:hypothetical protein